MRSNILWVCTGQQRYETIGALGNEHIPTPNIDRLVGEGTAFIHAFCQGREAGVTGTTARVPFSTLPW